MRYAASLARMAALALRRPRLGLALLGAAWRFRARDWYRRAPFLPLPPPRYVAWRMHTAFGDEEATPDARLLARYLAWAVRMNRERGS